jgi:DNA-directed RNA polymerase subunit RPC12/RpoP
MKKKIEEKPIAVLTLHDVGKWSPKIQAQVVNWLRDKAEDLVLDSGEGYTKVFTAKFFK